MAYGLKASSCHPLIGYLVIEETVCDNGFIYFAANSMKIYNLFSAISPIWYLCDNHYNSCSTGKTERFAKI